MGKQWEIPNEYTTGVIGEHDVVLAYVPGLGTASAAAVMGAKRVKRYIW